MRLLCPQGTSLPSLIPAIIFLLFSLLPTLTSAQFQFFDSFFSGQQQQQQQGGQERQNVASDSAWYQKTWEGGMYNPRLRLYWLPQHLRVFYSEWSLLRIANGSQGPRSSILKKPLTD